MKIVHVITRNQQRGTVILFPIQTFPVRAKVRLGRVFKVCRLYVFYYPEVSHLDGYDHLNVRALEVRFREGFTLYIHLTTLFCKLLIPLKIYMMRHRKNSF